MNRLGRKRLQFTLTHLHALHFPVQNRERLFCNAKDIDILFVSLFGGVIVVAALGYGVLAIASQLKRSGAEPAALPAGVGVTVFKPMCGATPETYGCLVSFCQQTHGRFQLLFGVADENDSAVRIIEQLRHAFPERDISLVVDRQQHGTSRKVSNLVNLLPHARYELLIIADSDVSVPPDYLSVVAAPLLSNAIGIVTCTYRAVPVRGMWSRIGAMFINEWFMPSVRVAALFGSRQFAFGATIAIRRDTLDAVGGFHAIANQLADDYRLGQLTRGLGKRTVLSPVRVDVVADDNSFVGLSLHEMRWLRTIRAVRPVGYALALVSLGPLAALLGAMMNGSFWAFNAVAVCCLLRTGLHFLSCGSPTPILDVLLLPLRDCLSIGLWFCAFFTKRVRWRERDYFVRPDGSLSPVEFSAHT